MSSRFNHRGLTHLEITLMLSLVVLAGCGRTGPELAPVSGRVLLDGQPLRSARVEFQPEGGKPPSYGFTDQEGRYQLVYSRQQRGALVGPHIVRLIMDRELSGADFKRLPACYHTASELRREVRSGNENRFDFELKSDAK